MRIKNPAEAVLQTREGRQFVMDILEHIMSENYIYTITENSNQVAARLERANMSRALRQVCNATDQGFRMLQLAADERRSDLRAEEELYESGDYEEQDDD